MRIHPTAARGVHITPMHPGNMHLAELARVHARICLYRPQCHDGGQKNLEGGGKK